MASRAPRSVLTAAIAGLALVALSWLGASAATPVYGPVGSLLTSMGGVVGPLLLTTVLVASVAIAVGDQDWSRAV